MKMSFDFTGKKILVTGAGHGIGRGIALALVKAGCRVYALDCNEGYLDALKNESPNIVTILQDLSDWEGTRTTLEGLEVLDGLVNNAGVALGYGPALDVSKEDLDKIMAVNLFQVINCTQVVCKTMVEAGKKGSVVNISSLAATNALPNLLGYDVSKAGADMAMKQFALELGPHNIRVNSVNATVVDTGIATAELREIVIKQCADRQPIARAATVEEIAGPVLYMLSDCSSMVTGTNHMVDGGCSCNITTKT